MAPPPRRLAAAVAVALLGSVVVAALGDPRPAGGAVLTFGGASPAPYVLVAWGLAVLALVGGAPTGSRAPAGPLRWIVLAAIAVRLPLLTLPAAYSDDVYRYVWEGRVWLAGANPFASPPDDPALAPLRDATWALVNHREVSSAYPPLAQALFVLLAPAGVAGWKLAMAAADVATSALLARRSGRAGWLWALLPLPALESAGSGHLEGVGVLLLVLAMGGSAAAAWAGAMVKLLPGALLVPLLGRRWRAWAAVGVATIVVAIPIATSGAAAVRGFETYRAVWAYNGSVYAVGSALVGGSATRPLLQVLGVAITAWALWRTRDPGRVALWVTGAFVALSPTVHPWYVLWPLAAAAWTGTRAWEVLAVGVPLAYVVLTTYDPATSSWVEPLWPRLVYYPAFFAALGWEAWSRATRANPGAV